MGRAEQTAGVSAGEIWHHTRHGYEILTTQVADAHVHYRILSNEPKRQHDAVREYIEENFSQSLVYTSPIVESCTGHKAFREAFEYIRDQSDGE